VTDLPPLDDIDGVYLSGYALLDFRSRESVLAMIKKIKSAGKPIFFDPTTTGAMKIVSREEVLSWVSLMDGILLNSEEALYLADETDVETAEKKLTQYTPLVVIKLGSKGAMGMSSQGSAKVTAVTTNVVDTTGAGDSFAAGFIPKWLETSDLTQALSAGAALAAKCVASVGARPPLN
jgi:sugar/nucleoside kinase (ribokinase family)